QLQDGIRMWIWLYPSNIPFHCFDTLDTEKFKRLGDSVYPKLEVTINDDSVIEQVSGLLSTCIREVIMDGSNFSPDDFSLFEWLLSNSTIVKLNIDNIILNDNTAPYILSLASLSKEIEFRCKETQLS
ncbi:hypothetical protein PMAYCL1PPCAC_22381, partial [Pristionchus mayeri]